MRLELRCTTLVLLGEIADERITQKSLALTYAMAINSSDVTDWKSVNDAIVKRWSRSGLKHVKEIAWKMIEDKSAR